jgi:arylsulfatase A-like enzyme
MSNMMRIAIGTDLGTWDASLSATNSYDHSRGRVHAVAAFVVIFWSMTTALSAEPDRTVLPLAEPPRQPSTVLDVRNATPPPRFEVKAPKDAPNVLLILIDDLGFAGTSAFGGPVSTPNFDRVAREGIVYTNFHTQSTCSPTRAALLSGRNPHVANMGGITEAGTAFPGHTAQIPNEVAPVAEMLRLNGFSTAAFGKWHLTPPWETSISGPFDRWPTSQGFDKFYGFMGFSTNHWAPAVIDGTVKAKPPETNFMTAMTDEAIDWMRFQKAITPDRPFFLYFAPGAVRAPHHPPQEWTERWKGKFDQGWDVMREQILKQQIELGIVPEGTALPPRASAIPAWDSLTPDQKRLVARQVEVFAGFVEFTDHEIGRLIEAVREVGELDNTLVIFVAGDNGMSAEGQTWGTLNEYTYFNGVEARPEDLINHLDDWGGPMTLPHMARGWAFAFSTPFEYVKQVGSDFGGTKVGMAIRWPQGGVPADDRPRSQFHFVSDVAPTILEAVGLPEPKVVNGTPQRPMDGISMSYTFRHALAEERRKTQYLENFGNRGIYHEGWLARTINRAPWETEARSSLEESTWDLFDTKQDFSLSDNLAARQPQKLAELQKLFMEEASRNFVLPIDVRTLARAVPSVAGRPDLMAGRNSLTLAEGMTGMSENVFIDVKNQSKTITAEIIVPETGGHGAIVVQGGRFGGWALYLQDGIPSYHYNFLNLQRFTVAADKPLPPGKSTIRFDFDYDGGGPGRGGKGTLLVNDQKVAEGRIERTQPRLFSADEGADIGIDLSTPVVEAIGAGPPSRFNGRIPKVTVEVRK